MSPEKHEIRNLEKHLDGAPPEVANQIARLIAATNALIMNRGNPDALALCRKAMALEVAALADLMLDQKPTE